MKTFKDDEFFKLEVNYNSLLKKLGLNTASSRFSGTFKAFRDVKKSKEYLDRSTVPAHLLPAFRYALFDLSELLTIYKSISDYSDTKVLKEKLKS